MSAIPPELLAGLLAEAQGYLATVRQILDESDNMPDKDGVVLMHRQMHTLGGATSMLGLDDLAELAIAAEELMEPSIEKQKKLTKTAVKKVITNLNKLDREIEKLVAASTIGADNGKVIPAPAFAPAAPRTPPPMTSPMADIPEELMEIFALEARDHNEVIQKGLEHLRKHMNDVQVLSDVRRAAHTLKGAAASVGFANIAGLTHLMEDLMERHLEGDVPLDKDAVSLLLESADALQGLIEMDSQQDIEGMLQSLNERYGESLGSETVPLIEEPQRGETPNINLADNLVRISLDDVDRLINRVGEIVINRAGLEGHLGTLEELLTELNLSTRRLNRLARDIDAQVETAPYAGKITSGDSFEAFDPLELDRYTLLHQYTLELEEVTSDTNNINAELGLLSDELQGGLVRERRLTSELQDGLMSTRLVPFMQIEMRLRRTVRRTASSLGKEVEIVFEGFETEVDKTILDTLVDPIMHLLRNSIDHGIEFPAARVAAGKPEVGTITMSVTRERGRVTLKLADDGDGINFEKVRQQAIELGLLDKSAFVTEEQLADFLFSEGFSLAEEVTQTSGRGVGLDIVRRAATHLQGTLRVQSERGRGTMFIISVPISLAITRALFVRTHDQVFAVPLEQISAVSRLGENVFTEIETNGVVRFEGRALSYFNLAGFIDGSMDITGQQQYGLVVESAGQETMVLIDGLVGTQEVVIKSLGSHLRRVFGISGATISGDGSVVLILDLQEIVASDRPTYQAVMPLSEPLPLNTAMDRLHVLVVDDSLSVRRVVTTFLETSGWQATPARDGIEALELLETVRPDVALVDIEMPRMNGFELLSRIKTDPALSNLPVVFLTSRAAQKHRDRASELGVDGYIVKPYQESQLLAELRRVSKQRVGQR